MRKIEIQNKTRLFVYRVLSVIVGLILIQCGYLAYYLNFSHNIGYSISAGVFNGDIFSDFLENHFPVTTLVLFMVLLILEVLIFMRIRKWRRHEKIL